MNPRINLKLAGALFAATIGLLCAAPPALGAGGTYSVVECSAANRSHDAAEDTDAGFDVTAYCADAGHDYAMQVNRTGQQPINQFRSGYWYWDAPPNTAIVGVDIEGKLRNDGGQHARISMGDGSGNQTTTFAHGSGDDSHWIDYHWSGAPQARLIASLGCEVNQCGPSDVAKTWVRNVKLTLVDNTDPALVNVGGTMLSGGWLRGPASLGAAANDSGSGLSTATATVNGVAIASVNGACHRIPGSPSASEMLACDAGQSHALSATPDTRAAPFHDGQNALAICAVDFARNANCHSETVSVDNTPPSVAFQDSENPADPELIAAPVSDATSGISSGSISLRPAGTGDWRGLSTTIANGHLQTRIDSESYPPGRYELMASATDNAGNSQSSITRQDGSPMVLTFPLKSASRITAHLHPGGGSKIRLPYGARARVTGRLLNANGKPLAHQRVSVTQHYAPGAVVPQRILSGTTDRKGRWHATLGAGPTRVVSASYPGNRRFIAAHDGAGRVVVKSKASFRTSRKRVPEGGSVSFHGRIAHRGAQIPGLGKLVELQVRQGAKKWNTVEQAIHSDSHGHYKLRYRFGRFYNSNVRYLFRVKIDHEQNWPYHAPVRSKARRVTVVAR